MCKSSVGGFDGDQFVQIRWLSLLGIFYGELYLIHLYSSDLVQGSKGQDHKVVKCQKLLRLYFDQMHFASS